MIHTLKRRLKSYIDDFKNGFMTHEQTIEKASLTIIVAAELIPINNNYVVKNA